MPHLQFEINKKLDKELKISFMSFVEKSFSEIMQTGTDHIAVTLRELDKNSLSLGRVNRKEPICLMNFDIRSGRTSEQQLKLIKTLIIGVQETFGIRKTNQYVTVTNHSGNEFNFFEKSLSDWVKNDNPTNKSDN